MTEEYSSLIERRDKISDRMSEIVAASTNGTGFFTDSTANEEYRALETELADVTEMLEQASREMEYEPDLVNNPPHYTFGTVECIDYIDSCGYGLDFCVGNAIKYLTRCKHKGHMLEDLQKAAWYVAHAIGQVEDGKYGAAGNA